MPTLAPEKGDPPHCSKQVLLGVFICWQLWFLVSENLCGWLLYSQSYVSVRRDKAPTPTAQSLEHLAPGFTRDDGEGHVFALAKWVTQTNKPWAHVTGQLQAWALFSGNYSRDGVFPALLVGWSDDMPDEVPWADDTELDWKRLLEKGDAPIEPRLFLTPHEPTDLTSYFRWRQMRMRRYENGLHLALTPEDGVTKQELAAAWDESIKGHLNNKGYLFTTYLKVKRLELEADWEGLPPPKQIILLLRRFRTVPADEAPPHWTGPHVVPLLLWEPPTADDMGPGRYKRFDPRQGRFRSWE